MDTNSRDHIEMIKKIDAYLKGRLSEEESDALWVELIEHPEYLEYLETEIALTALQKRQNTPIISLKRSWKWMAAAASIALLIAVVNLLKTDTGYSLEEMTLSQIPMAEHLEAPMVTRSGEDRLSEVDSLLNVAFEAALSSRMEEATAIYEEVVSDYPAEPGVAKAYINIGIIQYNRGDFEEAAALFERAVPLADDTLLREKVWWYMGNTYLKTGRLEEARKTLQSAWMLDGVFRKQSFRLLRKLDYELGYIDTENFERQIKDR